MIQEQRNTVGDVDERRRTVDDLFDAALDQPPDQRAAWLRWQTDDPSICAEVETLLAAAESSDGLLDRNAAELAGDLIATLRIEQIGPYRVLRELGRGGMGIVYLAERSDGQYRRRVAIKVLRASPDADDLQRRFLAERQILASLNHPNIAQLLDGGVTEGRLPFLVMEYVDGVPITTYCDRQRLGVEERLRLPRRLRCGAPRPPESRHSSRHQAEQHPRQRRPAGEAAGLRHREAREPGARTGRPAADADGVARDDAGICEP
jgi:hypothetical protein